MTHKNLLMLTFCILGIVSFGFSIMLLFIIAEFRINILFFIELGLIFCNVLFFSLYKELQENEK